MLELLKHIIKDEQYMNYGCLNCSWYHSVRISCFEYGCVLSVVWKLCVVQLLIHSYRGQINELEKLGARFDSTYTKIGMIQARIAWPPQKDDTQIREVFHVFF